MKAEWEDDYKMRDEYDFSKGVKHVWTQRFQQLNLVSLDPDVKEAFPDSGAVNKALRGLMEQQRSVVQEHSEAA
jgi:hypothetical protein